jgi:hypothetical protein
MFSGLASLHWHSTLISYTALHIDAHFCYVFSFRLPSLSQLCMASFVLALHFDAHILLTDS